MKFRSAGFRLLGVLLLFALGSIGYDLLRHRRIGVCPSPARGLNIRVYDDLQAVHHGRPVDWTNLEDTLLHLDDFLMAPLLRIGYRHRASVDAASWERIQRSILGFRYWMDQPGEDSRCYWSENHQILYASAEFLAGQLLPDSVFTRDGRSGREHCQSGRRRVLTWLEQRWSYGFAEWYSNVYYVEDIAPLCNLIDFSDDEEIVTKSRIILDLLLYDVATQSLRGSFVSTMGRAYGKNRMSGEGGNSMRGIIQAIWGFDLPVPDGKRMDGCFLFRERYQVPEVIKAIGRHEGPAVILASQGLDLAELRVEQAGRDQDARIMLQWGMEAFSNPEVIDDTLNYVDRHRMFSNAFLKDLISVDFTLLRRTSALPLVSRWLDPASNGTPLQCANTYTYRTPHFLLASVQHYHPGELNDQHHVWSATLSNRLSIFTAHPPWIRPNRVPPAEDPGYWVGPGRLPDAAQHENVCLLIYRVPDRPTMGEKGVSEFTHAYFPRELFDRIELRGKRVYGQHGAAFVALIGRFPLNYRTGSTSDLVQEGLETTWVCEVSDRSRDGDFDAFVRRMDSNHCGYGEGQLTYLSGGRRLVLPYGKLLRVDDREQPGQYPRHESPYAMTRRKAENMTLEFGGHRLFLDFAQQLRREG
ncbi:MAG: hypothetical protein JNN01_22055 [Opitutaceae bacterium]|nr:hypothetical protein [Opitutaceae bacterium]